MIITSKPFIPPFGKPFLKPFGDQAVAFSPLDLNPIAWWDAIDVSTVTVTGQGASTWSDKSGNSNDLLQTIDNDRPAYTSGVSLDFDGVSENMVTSTFTGGSISQPNTIFIAHQPQGIFSSQNIYDGIANGSRHTLFAFPTTLAIFAGVQLNTSPAINSGTAKVIEQVEWNTTSSVYRRDGISRATGNVGTNPLSGLTLAARFSIADFMDSDVFEIVIVNGALTVAQQNQLGNYLADRHGITWTNI